MTPDLDRKKRTRAILIALTVLFLPLAFLAPWARSRARGSPRERSSFRRLFCPPRAHPSRFGARATPREGRGRKQLGSAGKGDSPSSGQAGKSSANSDEEAEELKGREPAGSRALLGLSRELSARAGSTRPGCEAAARDALIERAIPAGRPAPLSPNSLWSSTPAASPPSAPQPERMTGCAGCFDYTTTEGRVNSIVVDPTTTANGTIVAYAANASAAASGRPRTAAAPRRRGRALTDDPLVSTTSDRHGRRSIRTITTRSTPARAT